MFNKKREIKKAEDKYTDVKEQIFPLAETTSTDPEVIAKVAAKSTMLAIKYMINKDKKE